MKMDGWVTIGTKLDSKQLEKDIADAEKELAQFEKRGERLATQKERAEIDLSGYEEEKRLINESTDESLKYAQTRQEVEHQLELEQMQLSQLEEKYSRQLGKLAEINSQIDKNNQDQQKAKEKVEEINQKLEESKKADGIRGVIKGIGDETRKAVNHVGKWALALFGIRSIISFIRSSMSTLAGENEQLGADIDYIKSALANVMLPVIQRIISLVYQLMQYVQYIVYAWTGKNIFAGASKNLKSAAGSAKELKKQMAGFDEMNTLQDNSGGGSGGGGGVGPSIDLSQIQGDVPGWVQWIADNGDYVIATLLGIAGAITAIKLGADLLTATGIGLLIEGIALAVISLIQYLKDPSWENFGKFIEGIGIALIGLAIIIGSIPVAIVGAVVLIFGIIIKYWEDIKAFLQKGIDWLTEKSDWVHQVFGDTIGNIYDAFVGVLSNMLKGWDNTFKAIKRIFDDVIKIVKALINGDWKGAWNAAKDIVTTIFDTIKKNIKLAFDAIWGIIKTVGTAVGNILWGAIKGVINGIMGAVESVINTPIKAINKLIGAINAIPGINLGKLSTFSLPRLAKGGIINQPGRGVLVGSAIAGERGAEGVIPLTDSQQMAMLGEAIGKYITVSNVVPVYLNGRQIAKEVRESNRERDFAFNR